MAVQFNPRFFDELSRGPGVTALLTSVGQEIMQTAKEDGPRDTEDYVDGIELRVKQQRRTVVLVVATDPKSMLIEAKTGNLVRALNKWKRRRRG